MAVTTPCPLTCPPGGWQQISGTGNNHCYLFPPRPIPTMAFWEYQNYCKNLQPTSYVVAVDTSQEYSAGCVKAFTYFMTYITGTFFVWLGAYYENGAFHWLDGSPWGGYSNLVTNPLSPPANGSCLFVDPRTTLGAWYYKPCDTGGGATVCEMLPLPDCSGTTLPTTPTAPYTSPDCEQPKAADFVSQIQKGYMGVTEMMTLTVHDVNSCAVACMYYEGCISFDISTSGDCRLLDQSVSAVCTPVVEDDTFQHYDLISLMA